MLPLLSVVSFLSVKLMARDAPSGICGGREEHALMMRGLVSASLVLGRSQKLGDADAVMVLPQTSPEPALPCGKGIQYNYKIVRFLNPMGIGQIHVSKMDADTR